MSMPQLQNLALSGVAWAGVDIGGFGGDTNGELALWMNDALVGEYRTGTPRGRWLRVHYAFAEDGSPRSGWVHLVPGKSVYHDRDRQLLEFSTTLTDPANTAFFSAPNGQPVAMDLRPSYTLAVLRVEQDWIQVVLMRPDTSACTGNENYRVTRRDTVWVRRHAASGKRQLTSAIAGC